MDSELDRKYLLLQIARVKAHIEAVGMQNHTDGDSQPIKRFEVMDTRCIILTIWFYVPHARVCRSGMHSWFRANKSEQDGGDNVKAALVEMTPQAGLARVVLEPVSRPTTPA